jgi:hypothetical protein
VGKAPEGSLTLFVLLARGADTLRSVLVDTYIAVRIRRWAAVRRGEAAPQAVRPAARHLGLGWGVASLALVGVLRPSLPYVLVSLILSGMMVAAVARVRYHRINIGSQPTALALKVAAAELCVGVVAMLLAVGGGASAPLAVWAVYVMRPVALERLTQGVAPGLGA